MAELPRRLVVVEARENPVDDDFKQRSIHNKSTTNHHCFNAIAIAQTASSSLGRPYPRSSYLQLLPTRACYRTTTHGLSHTRVEVPTTTTATQQAAAAAAQSMLSMVSSNDRRGADMHAHTSRSVVEQENYGVRVKHADHSSTAELYDSYRRHDNSTRGVLTATPHTASNVLPPVSGGAESDASSKARKEKRSTKSKCPPGLRSGKWTLEEEAFTNLLIHYFKRGLLHVDDGTSLRWYLAKRLNCEAMRVTKKLKGNSSIGKQIFRALEPTDENADAIAAAAQELAVVEAQFIESLAALAAPTAAAATSNTASGRGKKAARTDASTLHNLQHVVRANSADARLLLHFIHEAHDTLVLEDGDDDSKSDRKRLFSEIETTTSADDDDNDGDDSHSQAATTAPSKRHFVKIENLMD